MTQHGKHARARDSTPGPEAHSTPFDVQPRRRGSMNIPHCYAGVTELAETDTLVVMGRISWVGGRRG